MPLTPPPPNANTIFFAIFRPLSCLKYTMIAIYLPESVCFFWFSLSLLGIVGRSRWWVIADQITKAHQEIEQGNEFWKNTNSVANKL